jgi:hypothetical protein
MNWAAISRELEGAPADRDELYKLFWTMTHFHWLLKPMYIERYFNLCDIHATLPEAVSELAELAARMVAIEGCVFTEHGGHAAHFDKPGKCAGCCAEWHEGKWM